MEYLIRSLKEELKCLEPNGISELHSHNIVKIFFDVLKVLDLFKEELDLVKKELKRI